MKRASFTSPAAPRLSRPGRGRLAVAATLAAAVLTVSALDARLMIRRYTIQTDKLQGLVRLALVTDLHSCKYGRGQRQLLDALEDADPDLVLLGGDIFDDELPAEGAMEFLRGAVAQSPCYYVTGNHEFWTGRVPEIKAWLSGLGVQVLDGDCVTIQVRKQTINLCGVDDPEGGESAFSAQLEQSAQGRAPGAYTLLLAHRPERMGQYAAGGFDLVLSGHAHGGQWRIPGLLNGLIAPDEGLFPAHAGGLYDIGGSKLLVSRGLARESTRVPRIWNRPELVIVDLVPAEA